MKSILALIAALFIGGSANAASNLAYLDKQSHHQLPKLLLAQNFSSIGVAASLSGNCPHQNPSDGCAGAPVNGIIQHSNFFTGYANQNGQSYAATPPTWDVAGVAQGYGVGYPTATSFSDPAPGGAIAAALSTQGCTYSSVAHTITCSGAHGGLTISAYDFGNSAGGGGCIRLIISGNITGHIIITNNNFVNTTTNGAQCNVNGGALVTMSANAVATDVTFSDNVCDSNAGNVTLASPNGLNPCVNISMSNNQQVLIQYNAFLHSTARAIQVSSSGYVNECYNYAEGFTYTPNQPLHGEFSEDSTSGGGTAALKDICYNTIMQPKDPAGLVTTALIFASAGAVGSTWTTFNVNNNTLVSNVSQYLNVSGIPTVVSGGSGFAVNDMVTIAGGTFVAGGAVVMRVSAVSGGVITGLDFNVGTTAPFHGVYTVAPTNPVGISSTTGAGTGAPTFNLPAFALASPASAAAEAAYDTYGTLNWTQNYFDVSGANNTCISHTSSPVIGTENFSGNINMISGAAVTAIGAC